ncbi:oligo alginate lyase [Planctomycetales bacterium]|nr:oligo alginate lyase [Planctomycetales bacterium]
MFKNSLLPCLCFLIFFCAAFSIAAETEKPLRKLDDSPAKIGEWGHRPMNGQELALTPPSFVWRPENGLNNWQVQVKDTASGQIILDKKVDSYNVFTPSEVLPAGSYSWKYRGFDKNKTAADWSIERKFTIPANAKQMPLPPREELFNRIPKEHPRIFVRPETITLLRQYSKKELSGEYKGLVKRCDNLLKNPPDTTEPPLYKAGKRVADELGTWWGNREKTIAVLENAALLAFVWNLNGEEKYAALSKKLLLETAKWNPKGATGYRYNDEAGMPYNYHFSRTYTFLNKYLTEDERKICREVMTIRGEEMYKHLYPRMFWTPFESHANRAWHFLGEVALAFYGEIPEADDWLWFALNKFYSSYPAWCDDDGGWHEGAVYWQSYQIRFCWWADAMRAAFNINVFDKPYYSHIGDYVLYTLQPGKIGGNFGDLTKDYSARSCLELVDIAAMQSGNPYWRWYVNAYGNYKAPDNYYTFIRKAAGLQRNKDNSKSSANNADTEKPPLDLPVSNLFRGTGLAALNTTLLKAEDNVQVLFLSTPPPFGNYSHGYDANNSYIFSAYNENLLINTGRRDYYGSPHHANWMWSTRSENNITVDGGLGQLKRSIAAVGDIVKFQGGKFKDGGAYDIVIGEASEGYKLEANAAAELKKHYPDGKLLTGYRRNIVFLKPDTLVVFDRLKASVPVKFEYWLHAKKPFQTLENYFPNGQSKSNVNYPNEFLKKQLGGTDLTSPDAPALFAPVKAQTGIGIYVDKVACRLDLLLPKNGGLEWTQTNQYDPNPESKVRANEKRLEIREWHLKGTLPQKQQEAEFLLVARPWKIAENETVPNSAAEVIQNEKGTTLKVKCGGKERTLFFPKNSDEITVE